MKRKRLISTISRIGACSLLVLGMTAAVASATEPCDPDFGECTALIEINSTDGDVGFHMLFDGDELIKAAVYDPTFHRIFFDSAHGRLKEQTMTETFLESAEPLCWDDGEVDPEDIVTLEEFLNLWRPGIYRFFGLNDDHELQKGYSVLTYLLPAAPQDVEYEAGEEEGADPTGVISWLDGDDLGECGTYAQLATLVPGLLPTHPDDVTIDEWEVVLEPDVEDGDPIGSLKFTIRVPGGISPKEVSVPTEYLASLPDNTPAKVEVGAIGGEDNGTFTETDEICLNDTDPEGGGDCEEEGTDCNGCGFEVDD